MPGLAKRRLPRIKPPQAVTGPGGGRVLVVDGGGSTRCALLGDMLAEEARKNGWAVRAGKGGRGGGKGCPHAALGGAEGSRKGWC
jgi:hypothetical protein